MRASQRKPRARVPHIWGDTLRGSDFQKGKLPVRKTIPGTFAAYGLLVASGLFVVAVFAGALWLTGESALWLGHALPHRLL